MPKLNLLTSSLPTVAFEGITDSSQYEHYPFSRRYKRGMVYFSADEFENNVYTDFEQELNQAIFFAKLKARDLAVAKTSTHETDTNDSGNSSGSEDAKLENEQCMKKPRKLSRLDNFRALWIVVNYEFGAYDKQTAASLYSSLIFSPSDSFCVGENLSRKERALIREAKFNAMRTRRPIDPEDECKFLRLRLDSPFTDPAGSMQPNAAWQHEQLKLENEDRIHEKALNFKYRLRMSLKPAEGGKRKSCLAGKLKVECEDGEKKVRFDDVHEAKKVRWVDVEHVAELAKCQHEEPRNAF